jgi:putative endonuclease
MLNIIKQAINAAKKSALGAAARTRGYEAEDAACAWLEKQGLQIVERNVRYTFGELDIVAWHAEGERTTLVLFEVRLRKNIRFGDAAASITPRKQARLWAAGEAYAAKFKRPPPMRIDVLAYSGENAEPLWIKNALG